MLHVSDLPELVFSPKKVWGSSLYQWCINQTVICIIDFINTADMVNTEISGSY